MTKRQIMVRAHELAREMDGHYAARIAAGLRQAWFEARLVKAGGNLWERGQHRRLYFNNLAELYGLELDRYNSGNISHARLDGEQISNNWARRISGDLRRGKFWYDLNTGTFASRDLNDDYTERLVDRITAA